MQSIIALAGAVGLAAAAFVPQYEGAPVESAASPNAYEATIDSFPSYTSENNAAFTPYSYYHNNGPAFRTPLIWSTTQYIRTSAYTTFCPEATTLSFNTQTYTITAATTLTVTDCYNGCAIVKPLPTTTIVQTAPITTSTQFETFCPEPTTLTFSTQTFTVTEATTLTIPQNITTTSVFKTVIPIQPTFAPIYTVPVNSTIRYVPVSTTYQSPAPVFTTYQSPASVFTTWQSPVAPVATIEPYVPAPPARTTEVSAIVAPVQTAATYNAPVAPYPVAPSKTAPYYYQSSANAVYNATSPPLYTGAATRVGAGALMAVAGLAVLL